MKGSFWLKRGISLAACLVMVSATTVAAAENTRLIHSQGQYTVNSAEGTIIIDTDDIEDNAEAIAALQGQLGGLSFRYGTEASLVESYGADKVTISGTTANDEKGYYWSQDSTGKWVKVGAVGTAIATDVLTGKKFSSEAGVDITGSMPNPTSARVSYYSGGNNDSSGATSTTPKEVAISNDTDTTASHTDNVSQINLGINEQITIPHGYYNKDIVIKNGVANRGSSPIILTSASNKQTLPSGYYDEFTISSNVPTTGTVTYVHHVHSTTNSEGEEVENSSASTSSVTSMPESQSTSGGCYTRGVSYSYRCGHWECTSRSGGWSYFRCTSCGATDSSYDGGASEGWGMGDHYRSGTNYYCSHNYSNGQIIRAIITY